jgi:hypothetical protein
MLRIKNRLIASAVLLATILPAAIGTSAAQAAVVVSATSSGGDLIAHRDRDRDDYYDNDDRYERQHDRGRHRGHRHRDHRNNRRDGYRYSDNNRYPREIYSDSSSRGTVIYAPQPSYPRGHNCVRTLYATICN